MTVEEFAKIVENQRIEHLKQNGLGCQANIDNCHTTIKVGKKYTKVDVGNSGKYMIDNATNEIFGIKAYGVIHRGHQFGTLDTVNDWYWGGYGAIKKPRSIKN